MAAAGAAAPAAAVTTQQGQGQIQQQQQQAQRQRQQQQQDQVPVGGVAYAADDDAGDQGPGSQGSTLPSSDCSDMTTFHVVSAS